MRICVNDTRFQTLLFTLQFRFKPNLLPLTKTFSTIENVQPIVICHYPKIKCVTRKMGEIYTII